MPSPSQVLIEHLYAGDLPTDVARARDAGESWRQMAARLSEQTGQPVSYESLRQWYGKQGAAA